MLHEFFYGQSCLFNDRFEGSSFKVFVVVGNGNAESRFIRVFENMVASPYVVHVKARPLERPENSPWFERGKFCGHAASSGTLMVSFTGRSLIFLSGGMGNLSFRRLSR